MPRDFGEVLAEAYTSWLNSVSSCYTSLTPCLHQNRKATHRRRAEKGDFVVFHDQPGFTPPPSFGRLIDVEKEDEVWRDRAISRSPSRRGRRTFRRRIWSRGSSSRRPRISAPSNFRHIYSESFQFPPPRSRRPRSFRPLELSIYQSGNRISSMLPHFATEEPRTTPPPPAHLHGDWSIESDSSTLAHQRSYSSMSFHLPRRPVPGHTSSLSQSPDVTLENHESPPRIPPRSRMRAYTSPNVERIVERIASAMIEKEKLQAEIDSIIERQSIYMSSRPSTAYGIQDLEPMPSIPALPAAGPSFAERLSFDRPKTAPPRPVSNTEDNERDREEDGYERSAVFDISQLAVQPRLTPPPINRSLDLPLAPPLPLVLRPPLRKKKSFSRVSNWLFPGGEHHHRDMSLDSITNAPMPVTDKEGFYQCVPPTEVAEQTSIYTVSSASSWETDEDERTIPTTTSPTGSPATKQNTPRTTPRVKRPTTFSRSAPHDLRRSTQSVGVAF